MSETKKLSLQLQKASLLGFINQVMECVKIEHKERLEKKLAQIMTTMVNDIDLSQDASSENCFCEPPMNNGINYCSFCGRKILALNINKI